MRFRILTVVWGDAFTERFLHFTLRSLLAPGNLRDLARLHEVTYHVYAPDDDFARMQASARFEQIASIVAIRHCKLSLASIDPRNAMSHWDPWKAGVAAARNDDVFVILVAPDHIFCRGALARWGGLLERGHLAVFSPGFQVAAETLGPELRRRFPEDSPIDLSVEDLHDVIFRHLHPIKIAMFGGNPHPIGHPEWHLRAVHGRGFVQRIVGSHAVAFHPRRIRLTDNFCPIEKLDRVAFEPSWFIGAEPLLKHVEMLLQPASIDDATLSYYGGWADRFITPANLRESAITHAYELAGDMQAAE